MYSSCLLALVTIFTCQVVESTEPVACLPCECSNESFGLYVICQIDKLDSLTDVFDTFRSEEKKIGYLEIRHSTATELPDGLIKGLYITSMHLLFPKLESLPYDTFESQRNSLDELIFSTASFTNIPLGAIAPLEKLRKFNLDVNSGFTHIPSHNGSPTETIETISYVLDGIKTIAWNAFVNYRRLVEVKIRSNQLTNIDSVVLPGNVDRIYANNNKLTSFPSKMLSSLQKGSQVYMNYNHITTFSAEDVDYLNKRKYELQILNNPFSCNCALKDLVFNESLPHLFGSCARPYKIYGKPLRTLKAKYFKDC